MLLIYLSCLHFSTYTLVLMQPGIGKWQTRALQLSLMLRLYHVNIGWKMSLSQCSSVQTSIVRTSIVYTVYNGLPVPKDMLKHIIAIFLFGLGVWTNVCVCIEMWGGCQVLCLVTLHLISLYFLSDRKYHWAPRQQTILIILHLPPQCSGYRDAYRCVLLFVSFLTWVLRIQTQIHILT